jgi:disulfide bond formation protein DsbB
MKKSFYYYLILICLALLLAALWLQHLGYDGVNYAPCPLCILQRIGYAGIALSCLFAIGFYRFKFLFHSIATLFSIFGLSVAIRQLWVIAHPNVSCGLDPLEVLINQIALTQYVPWFFKADGFCSAPLPPLLGLSVPVWSLIWFSILTLTLLIGFIFIGSKKRST